MSDFPCLYEDDEQGRLRVIRLPIGETRHGLQRLAFDRVHVRRRPVTLAFGPDDAIAFDENGGSVKTRARQ